MYRAGLVLMCCTIAACATPQETQAEAQECVGQVEESTGSRVNTTTVCKPAEPD